MMGTRDNNKRRVMIEDGRRLPRGSILYKSAEGNNENPTVS